MGPPATGGAAAGAATPPTGAKRKASKAVGAKGGAAGGASAAGGSSVQATTKHLPALQLGLHELNAASYAAAIAQFQESLKIFRDERAVLALAVAQLAMGDIAGAVSSINSLPRPVPGRAPTVPSLAPPATVALVRGVAAARAGRREEALVALQDAVRLNRSGSSLTALSAVQASAAQWHEAALTAKAALETVGIGNDDHAIASAVLGVAQAQTGRAEAGLMTLQEAARKHAGNAAVKFCLAVALDRSGQTKAAHRAYSDVLTLIPEHYQALCCRAVTNLKQHMLDAALADYKTALAVDATSMGAYLGRATAYINAGKGSLALPDLKKCLDLLGVAPAQVPLFKGGDSQGMSRATLKMTIATATASIYMEQEDYGPAIPLLTTCIDSDGTNVGALFCRSVSYEKTDNIQSALKDCQALLTLEPDNASFAERQAGLVQLLLAD